MSAQRPWAWPLVPVYRAAAVLEAALYGAGILRTNKLQWPVISVGSLSAGGAGKTPVVMALATTLRGHGWHVDVLSRGYGRKGRAVERVAPTGSHDDARRFGDEPVLIAERTGVAVWVGADRFAAGMQAEESQQQTSSVRVHLLDDGFQHRRLARDFDIVLVTAEDLADSLLPAGNLREPLTALGRADAVVVREEEREDLEARVRELTSGSVPVWSVRRSLRFPPPLGVFTAGLRPMAFCAIARPEGFAAMLAEAGCGVVETVAFRDHHAYTLADAERLVEIARRLDASGLVTTEKDAVKLTPALRERLAGIGPLAVIALEAEFVYKAPVVRALQSRLQTQEQHPQPGGKASHAREARLR